LADYDGDGRLDLIAGSDCCQEGCFYVFRRLKDGGFAPRQKVKPVFPLQQFNVTTSIMLSRIAVADLNGDGKPDVLIGTKHWKTLGVVYGPLAGKDELTVQRMWPEGQEPFAPMSLSTNPVLADWDGDGLPDLLLGVSKWSTDSSGRLGVYWCRNVGTKRAPKFGPPQLLVADNELVRTTGICVADWNGDGRPDLIASRTGSEVGREGKHTRRHHKVWVYLRRGR
jgi:FG-GAP-like repeat